MEIAKGGGTGRVRFATHVNKLLILVILSISLSVGISGCTSSHLFGKKPLKRVKRKNVVIDEAEKLRRKQLARKHLSSSVKRGRQAFQRLCIKCHGKNATGGGVGEGVLGAPVRDLTDKAYISVLTDKELFKRIAYGNSQVPYIVMPGWLGQITSNKIYDIIAYVRSLETDRGPLKGLSPHERMELYNKNPLERGRVNYLKYCSQCHGFSGKGDGWAVKGPSARPTVFANPSFSSSYTRQKVFDYVKGLDKEKNPERTMPVFGNSISPDTIEVIISYIFTLSEAALTEHAQ